MSPAPERFSTTAEGVVTLADLSKRVGLSPFHLQRLFKRATGLSPREYQSARRMQHVKNGLRKGDDVTTALYDAGFGSPSRLYETGPAAARHDAGRISSRRRGREHSLRHRRQPTGPHVGGGDRARVVRGALWRNGYRTGARPAPEFHAAEFHRDDKALREYVEPLLAAIRGDKSTIDLPLDVRATAFQKKVWDQLKQIPHGETRSYTDIAREIGSPAAVRAVARACASNPGGHGGALSSRRSQRRRPGRISLGNRAQEEAAGRERATS